MNSNKKLPANMIKIALLTLFSTVAAKTVHADCLVTSFDGSDEVVVRTGDFTPQYGSWALHVKSYDARTARPIFDASWAMEYDHLGKQGQGFIYPAEGNGDHADVISPQRGTIVSGSSNDVLFRFDNDTQEVVSEMTGRSVAVIDDLNGSSCTIAEALLGSYSITNRYSATNSVRRKSSGMQVEIIGPAKGVIRINYNGRRVF